MFINSLLNLFMYENVSSGMTQGVHRKDELYNSIIDLFHSKDWYFRADMLMETSYVMQVSTEVLYGKNHFKID